MISLRPSDIRFTQNSISELFSDRGGTLETIEQTFKEILYGETEVDDIRPLTVVEKDGLIWVKSGNRRLYMFKMLENYGCLDTVSVNFYNISNSKFRKIKTTNNEGESVAIRQDKQRPNWQKLANRLDTIYNNWVKVGRPTRGIWSFNSELFDTSSSESESESDDQANQPFYW